MRSISCAGHMKAVVLTRYGGPEVLRIVDVPEPEPRAGEVGVRVRAIGLNYAEVLSRRGLYSWAPPLPYILAFRRARDWRGERVEARRRSLTRRGSHHRLRRNRIGLQRRPRKR